MNYSLDSKLIVFIIFRRFEGRVKYDQECCMEPDTETPFRGKLDAVMRLIG